jgi:pyruvate/2-oxoglutarate dehydrogenase complex dihydrolipoamide dehydrogenase (E3) component
VAANTSTQIPDIEGVFAGGDCVTGPATVIRAIAAGKAAAANIDEYLGFNHEVKVDVKVPTPRCADLRPRGRVNPSERDAAERKCDFECIECGMTAEEAAQESSRCLRCDHFGYGNFKGGRVEKW